MRLEVARILVAAAFLAAGTTACKTRLLNFWDDGGTPDLAAPADLASADLTAIDLAMTDCPPEAKLVYVFDAHTRMLSSFRPDTLAFRDIRTLDCPASSGLQPMSMAVQRDGTAWVGWGSFTGLAAQIFRVDVKSGACDSTPHPLANGGPDVFGMAIALDGGNETLYVAGGTNASGLDALGVVDLASFVYTPRGPVDGRGDLTSDSNGHLYTFLPDWNGAVARVEDLDKTSGAALRTWMLPQIDSYMGDVAIAYWGGAFWLFAGMGPGDGTTTVLRLDPASSALTTAIANTGRHVVGAGVAPCR